MADRSAIGACRGLADLEALIVRDCLANEGTENIQPFG